MGWFLNRRSNVGAITPTTITFPQVTLRLSNPTRQVTGTLGAGVQALILSIDRTVAGGMNSLTDQSVYDWRIEISYDGGVNWNLNVEMTQVGGAIPVIISPKTGLPVNDPNTDTLTTTLLDTDQPSRMARITCTISGPSNIVVAGSLVVS